MTQTTCRKRKRLEEYERSETVEKLIDMVGRGQVSISAAAGVTHCVVKDFGLNKIDSTVAGAIQAFSSLGNTGQNPGNYERDLHVWLQSLFGFRLQTYQVWINLEAPR